MTSKTLTRMCLLMALLVPTGCAYKSSMNRAEKAAAAGDWYDAWTRYNEAYGLDPTTEAADGLNTARVQTLATMEQRALDTVGSGDWEGSAEVIRITAEVTDRNDPEAVKVRDIVSTGLNNAISSLLDADRVDEAYDLGQQALELYPDELFAETAIDKVRSRLRTQSEELAAEGDYEGALAKLQVIVEREPEWKEKLALPEQQIREGWASQLTDRAALQYKWKRYGAAALYYARAYEVAGRVEDKTAATESAREVEYSGMLKHFLEIDGHWPRVKAIRGEIRGTLAEQGHTGRGGKTTSDLVMNVDVPKPYCSESKTTEAKSLDYVSGQREVPNPEYLALDEEVQVTRDRKKELDEQLRAATPDFEKARDEVGALDEQHQAAETAAEEAQKSLDRARKQHQEQVALVDKLQADLDAAGDAQAREAVQVKVKAISKNVAQWESEIARWEGELAAQESTMSELEVDRAPATEAFERLREGYKSLRADKEATDKKLRDVEGRLLKLSPTLLEDIPETMEYDVVTWTRTCKVPLYARDWTVWESATDDRLKLETETTATDTAAPGNKKAGLAEDPKEYPKTDDELIAEAEQKNIEAIGTWLKALTAEHFAAQAAKAMAGLDEDPEKAGNLVVALWVRAPQHLDEATTKALRAKVKKAYGLEKMEILTEE